MATHFFRELRSQAARKALNSLIQKKKTIHRHKADQIRKVVVPETTAQNDPAGDTQPKTPGRRRPTRNFFAAALERVKSGKPMRFIVEDFFKMKRNRNPPSVPPRRAQKVSQSFQEYYPSTMPSSILSLLVQRYTTLPPANADPPRWASWPRWIASAKLAGRIVGPLGSG